MAWQFPEIHTGQPRIVDHVAVLNCLRGLECNEEYYSSRIPMGIMMQLKKLLPEDGLLPFLKQHPRIFDITIISGQANRKNKLTYTFKVDPSISKIVAQPMAAVLGQPLADKGQPSPRASTKNVRAAARRRLLGRPSLGVCFAMCDVATVALICDIGI